jgi:hypothetical protein
MSSEQDFGLSHAERIHICHGQCNNAESKGKARTVKSSQQSPKTTVRTKIKFNGGACGEKHNSWQSLQIFGVQLQHG